MGVTIEEANRNCEQALTYVRGKAISVRHDIGTLAMIQKKTEHMKKILP